MSLYSSKKYSYFAQYLILLFIPFGFLLLGVLSLIFSNKLGGAEQAKQSEELLKSLNYYFLLALQLIGTFFMFCLPAFLYAKICHQRARKHLGLANLKINFKLTTVVILVMLASLLMVGFLSALTTGLPWSEKMRIFINDLEKQYETGLKSIVKINSFGQYLVSLLVIAVAPAFFEEVFFRGGLQNILTRHLKKPIWAIIITSLIFSAIHFSVLGFLGRMFLGMVLGWIFYRTKNLWYCIIAHAFNNGLAVTLMYIFTKLDGNNANAMQKINELDRSTPLWIGLIAIPLVVGAYYIFEKFCPPQSENGHEENEIDDVPSWMNN